MDAIGTYVSANIHFLSQKSKLNSGLKSRLKTVKLRLWAGIKCKSAKCVSAKTTTSKMRKKCNTFFAF